MSLADAFAVAETRRDTIRQAVLSEFDICGDMRYTVRRDGIHKTVQRVCGLPFVAPHVAREINMLCAQLGGMAISVSNRKLIRGVRRRGVPDDVALRQSRELVTRNGDDVTGGKKSPYQRQPVNHVRDVNHVNHVRDSKINYEKILASEGMPIELSTTRVTDTTKQEINSARMAKASQTREIMRLYAEGKSIRKVATALGIDRNVVHKVLIANGLGQTPGER